MLIALNEFASVFCVDLSVFKRVYAVKKGVRFFSPVRESIRVVFLHYFLEAGQIRVEFICREVGESMMGRVHELGFVRTRELRKTRLTIVRASYENVTAFLQSFLSYSKLSCFQNVF